jgi:hypothetical protein
VVDRLRALLEHPHDPAVARAVVVLACWLTIGLAVLIGLGGAGVSDQASTPSIKSPRGAGTSVRPSPPPAGRSAVGHLPEPRQDPQDRPGSAARRRAEQELASHRALQHVPWHGDGVSIRLIGVQGTRAALGVEAASVPAARRGWRGFLRRYRDDGRAYQPRFEARRVR